MEIPFKNTEEIRGFIPISKNFDFTRIRPAIVSTARSLFTYVIGGPTYELLLQEYAAPQDTVHGGALKLFQETLIHFAYFRQLPYLSVNLSDTVYVSEGKDKSGVRKWQLDAVQEGELDSAHGALNSLLRYFEDNENSFQDWRQSKYYTKHKDLLLNTPEEFSEYFSIKNSYRMFLALKPHIRTAERQISGHIPDYNGLKERLRENTLTPEDETLLGHIRPVLVYRGLANGIISLSVELVPGGILTQAFRQEGKEPESARLDRLSSLQGGFARTASGFMGDLEKHITTQHGTPKQYHRIKNTAERKTFHV